MIKRYGNIDVSRAICSATLNPTGIIVPILPTSQN